MKFKYFGWSVLLLLILTNIWAILTDTDWLKNSTFILYFLCAVLLVLDRYKKFDRFMFLFISLTLLSYLVRYFEGDYFSHEISLLLLSAANIFLIFSAFKYIEIKNASIYMWLYFIVIIGFNGVLLGYHVMEIKDYINSNLTFSIYILYYINLLIFGIIAFVYYLNSYSKKSMYFISLALGIIFADILRDMGVFFPRDLSVEVAESIIRMGCAIFAVLFFVTKEKQLRLLNLI